MNISAFYQSSITGTETECILVSEGGHSEWRHAGTNQRIMGTPIWINNQFEGLDWFAKVYAEMKPRFVLK